MKITASNGEIEINDEVVPSRFLGSPVTLAITDLGVADPTILVFPRSYGGQTNNAVSFSGLGAEVTGYVRLVGGLRGVYPDLTHLQRVDGKALTSQDFDIILESLEEQGFFEYAAKVIRVTLDPEDPWLQG